MALPAAVLAVILNVAILALWVQRTRAARGLAAQIANIEENLAYVEQIDEAEIEELRADLSAAEDRLAALERDLTAPEAPFEPVTEVSSSAERSGLEILSVETAEVTTEEVEDMTLTVTRFSFQADCGFRPFVEFVHDFEAGAPESVSLDSMEVTLEQRSCSFEVIVLSGLEVESE